MWRDYLFRFLGCLIAGIFVLNAQALTFRQTASIKLIRATKITALSLPKRMLIRYSKRDTVIDITPQGGVGSKNTADFIIKPSHPAIEYKIQTPTNSINFGVVDLQNVKGVYFSGVKSKHNQNFLLANSTILYSKKPIYLAIGMALRIAKNVKGSIRPQLMFEVNYD